MLLIQVSSAEENKSKAANIQKERKNSMKTIKKIVALVITVMLVATLCIPAMAAPANRRIKINAEAFPNHKFAAYQVFTGTLSNKTLTDIVWGRSVDTDELASLVTALKAETFADTDAEAAITALTATSTAEDFANAFTKIKDGGNADDAQLLGHVLYEWDGWIETTALKTADTNTSSPYYITGTDANTSLGNGYYLVKDITTFSTTTDEDKDVRSSAFLSILGNGTEVVDNEVTYQQTTITFKGQVPTPDKQSGTTEGTYSEHNTLATALPAQPGDTVYYQLKGTLPSNYSDYDSYYYEFIDTPSNIEIDSTSVKLYVKKAGETTLTEANIDGTKVKKTIDSSTGVLTIEIADTNDILKSGSTTEKIAVKTGAELYVKYSAKVTNDALTEGAGNTLSLKYSNDPFSTSKGKTGDEPEYIKTSYAVLVKYDGADNKCLAGANFSLYNAATGGTAITLVSDSKGYHVKSSEDTATGVTSFDTTDGQIYITGLDSTESYYLEENTPPTGYNSLSSRVALTLIEADPTGSNSLVSASIDATTKVYTATTKVTAVENNKGNILPETGGIGTTLFITFGAIAVIGAGIFLVTNKRMSKEEI